eukprot:322797_1
MSTLTKTGNKNAAKGPKRNNTCRISKSIATQSEEKQYSYEENEYFTSEYYLIENNTKKSTKKFADINCVTTNAIIPLKNEILSNPPNKTIKDNMLSEIRTTKYKTWLIELKTGFNLLFYGAGSKKLIIQDFGKTYCAHDPDGIVIRINGYDEKINVKLILDATQNIILDSKTLKNTLKKCRNLENKAKNIVQYLDTHKNLKYSFIYLIINNIDGQQLRSKKTQNILSTLSTSPNIHIIASIDHFNSHMMWDSAQTSAFKWIYHVRKISLGYHFTFLYTNVFRRILFLISSHISFKTLTHH